MTMTGESIYSTVFPGGVFVVRDDGNDDLRTLVLVNGTPSITQKRIFTIKAPDSRAGELKIEAFVEVNKEWVSALFESRVMHPADTNMPVVGNFTDFKNILTAACKEAGTTIKPGSRVASLQASPLTPPKPHPQAHSTGGKTKKGKGQATLPETTAFDVNHEAGSNEHLALNMGLHVLLGGLKCGMCADIAVKAVGLVTDTLLLEKLLDARCLLAYVGGATSSRDRVSKRLMTAWDSYGVAVVKQLVEDGLFLEAMLEEEDEMKEGYLLRTDRDGLEQNGFLTPWQVALLIYLQFAAAGIALEDVKKVVTFATLYAGDAKLAPALFANIMASDALNNKLVVVLSRGHFTVVAKPGFPVGTAFNLMSQGVDDRPEAYVDAKAVVAAFTPGHAALVAPTPSPTLPSRFFPVMTREVDLAMTWLDKAQIKATLAVSPVSASKPTTASRKNNNDDARASDKASKGKKGVKADQQPSAQQSSTAPLPLAKSSTKPNPPDSPMPSLASTLEGTELSKPIVPSLNTALLVQPVTPTLTYSAIAAAAPAPSTTGTNKMPNSTSKALNATTSKSSPPPAPAPLATLEAFIAAKLGTASETPVNSRRGNKAAQSEVHKAYSVQRPRPRHTFRGNTQAAVAPTKTTRVRTGLFDAFLEEEGSDEEDEEEDVQIQNSTEDEEVRGIEQLADAQPMAEMEKNAGTKTNGQAVDLNVIAAEDGAAQEGVSEAPAASTGRSKKKNANKKAQKARAKLRKEQEEATNGNEAQAQVVNEPVSDIIDTAEVDTALEPSPSPPPDITITQQVVDQGVSDNVDTAQVGAAPEPSPTPDNTATQQAAVDADVSGGDVAVAASGAGHVIGEDTDLTTHDAIAEGNGDKTTAPSNSDKADEGVKGGFRRVWSWLSGAYVWVADHVAAVAKGVAGLWANAKNYLRGTTNSKAANSNDATDAFAM